MKFFLFCLLSLNVKWLRCSHLFLCLSVDESRDKAKNIFWLCTVIINYFEIIEYLVSYASHFEGHTPRISKIYISWKSSDPTGNFHIFTFLWSKWPISTPDIRDGHVIHQIEANEPGIIIKIVLAKNFYQESKYIEKFKFWKFSPMTS